MVFVFDVESHRCPISWILHAISVGYHCRGDGDGDRLGRVFRHPLRHQTDINKLISRDLPWRQREAAFQKQFPGHFQSTLAVIDAPTPELAAAAATELTASSSKPAQICSSRPRT